jgi:CRP-like cAMP-binding protein
MYLIARGEVEVLDDSGRTIKTLKDGDFFGEVAILLSTPRNANVRAKTGCDLWVLDKSDFHRILHDHPQFSEGVAKVAKERYDVSFSVQEEAQGRD